MKTFICFLWVAFFGTTLNACAQGEKSRKTEAPLKLQVKREANLSRFFITITYAFCPELQELTALIRAIRGYKNNFWVRF